MDLAMMLSADKREEASSPPYVAAPPTSDQPSHPHKRARTDAPVTPLPSQQTAQPRDSPTAAASSPPPPASSPYSELRKAVHNALESRAPALTTADKVALALEVLRARQLELDLAQARSNIEALVNNSGTAPRTLRAVIPSTAVKGLPVGTPVDIERARFLLTPTTNDPQALFLTLELQSFGGASQPQQQQQVHHTLPNGNHNETQSQTLDTPSQ
ncbi:hypothetical protein BWQ96_01862 [Gracilariopsis chorda]|uniref:Uncharacterized protein n=1 Tax=Gracilariopsis chorda TaxID=448386 RepID=A0A2V3J2R8_9FLOR|nr:hypothetical protein BWQ96_01862 [Gracilariopsis chorda]|eukprot:PXF48402.1 hypothetical protein BWQ96_01862 [Gracilariopsis chorda]